MWHRCKNNCAFLPSRLARALWIEIAMSKPFLIPSWSRLARALWIEIGGEARNISEFESRLARALWIEIDRGATTGNRQ